MRKIRSDGQETREAILAAAVDEFTVRGFAGASTRAICARAGVNNALLNRYFGTKENLYRIVAKSLFGDLGAPLAVLADGISSPEAWRTAVRTWVDGFLFMTIPSRTAQRRCAALFREEVTHPTKFHGEFARDFGKPVYTSLRRLMAMGTDDPAVADLWTSSVWAQVSVYALADSAWLRWIRPPRTSNAAWAARVGDHICGEVFAALSFRAGAPRG